MCLGLGARVGSFELAARDSLPAKALVQLDMCCETARAQTRWRKQGRAENEKSNVDLQAWLLLWKGAGCPRVRHRRVIEVMRAGDSSWQHGVYWGQGAIITAGKVVKPMPKG